MVLTINVRADIEDTNELRIYRTEIYRQICLRKLKTHRYGNFVHAYNNVVILHFYEKVQQTYDRVLNSPLSSLCRSTFSSNSQTDEFSVYSPCIARKLITFEK